MPFRQTRIHSLFPLPRVMISCCARSTTSASRGDAERRISRSYGIPEAGEDLVVAVPQRAAQVARSRSHVPDPVFPGRAIEVRRTLRVVCKPSLGMKVAMSRKTSMLAAPRSPITSTCHSDTGASKFMLSVTGRGASYCAVIWAGVRAVSDRGLDDADAIQLELVTAEVTYEVQEVR